MGIIEAKIKEHKIIPVIGIEKMDDVLPLADSLTEGGLPLIEITFRTKIAPEAIKLLQKERPEMLIGAGTVLTNDELELAIDNGAAFGVAPGFNPKIVEEALKNNFFFMPGILTPSDLEAALSMGINVFKFFPAEAAGGVKYLKSLSAPYT
ncbi:bifunctional 4-hydroxy-2-oxoglutarate aldolase/2-dehydro-3-deoxy-phosphogluconate aldolase, partial [bacterium]|nr:bifunctional 4-hydroxy-2-oxoglutarate aldolase/2-dehydro-3-deoxy-phosphogluconate aldolase [bacterium]